MADNDAFATASTPFGTVGLLAPLVPDVTLVHGAVADEEGNVALSEPLLEGAWGAWAARRGVIATVDKVVESLDGLGHRTKIPAHRVLAVVETPFGAHPGGLYAPGLPVDLLWRGHRFWTEARAATRGDFDAWARQWVLEPTTHGAYLDRLGRDRLAWLAGRTDPTSWQADAEAHPVDEDDHRARGNTPPPSAPVRCWPRWQAVDADAVLAGAGVANLAAWVAVARAGPAGHRVKLTAELGLWGYNPTPADPYIFNHRVFPGTPLLADASTVLGMVVGGPGTRTVACLGAAQVDRHGNLNSTTIPGGPFLVGSGGANDVASRATACVVVSLARPERLVEQVGYVTSPGRPDDADRHRPGCAAPPRRRPAHRGRAQRPRFGGRARAGPGRGRAGGTWRRPGEVEELDPVTHDEVMALRRYDPERLFLPDPRRHHLSTSWVRTCWRPASALVGAG